MGLTHDLTLCFCSGAFLIPYISFLLLGGIPLFFMELSIGQILQAGPVKVWRKLSSLFSGASYSDQITHYDVEIFLSSI